MRSSGVTTLVLLAVLGAAVRAQKQNQAPARDWQRFHVGAAVGESSWNPDLSEFGLSARLWAEPLESGTARKVFAGFRPVRAVGVEIQYVDFGEADTRLWGGRRSGSDVLGERQAASADAWVLAALLYIPEPSPSIDVYGKVGVADLNESFTGVAYEASCQPICSYSNFETTLTKVTPRLTSASARFKAGRAVGVRLEYEAIDRADGDDMAIFSVGLAFER